ncbi:MAG: calcium-binding protein, partial [Campylobacter sp.]|nr:calcium-binding protein [Campylobacter sp.]
MSYTEKQANAELRKIAEGKLPATKAELTRIIENLSVETSGQKTVLYSGMNMNEIEKLAKDPKLRMLNNTEAYQFVNKLKSNKAFIDAWGKITGDTKPNFDDYNSQVGKFIGGEDPANGKPRKMGAWDIISKNFAKETNGEVVALIGKNAKVGRVFFQTEFEALKHNSNVTKINGVDKLAYMLGLDLKDQYQLDKMKLESQAILLTGKNINDITQKDMEAILKNKDFAESFKDIVTKYKPEELPKFYKHLNKIGTLGSMLGFSVALYNTSEAYNNGNPELAKEIMGEYVSESAGGIVGGSAFSMGTFMLLGAAGITVSAPVAIATALITSIAGGIAGSDIASYLYKSRDVLSYFFNPWDENWQGRDQEWLEEFKNFWSPYLDNLGDDFSKTLQETKDFYNEIAGFWKDFFGFGDDTPRTPGDLTDTFNNYVSSTIIYRDPLVLDLNNDGIQTINLQNSNTFFDLGLNEALNLKNQSLSNKTGWISKEDGFLVTDRNNDGKINDISEMFGNSKMDGFTALRNEFDSNKDGIINSNDENFNNLKIWIDGNSNGITDKDELKTLEELGIKSIDLGSKNTNYDNNGNKIVYTSNFTKQDGTTGAIANVNFRSDAINTNFTGEYNLSLDAILLPHLRGYGKVADTHIKISQDDEFAKFVKEFGAQSITDIKNNFGIFLAHWTGLSDIWKQGGITHADLTNDDKAWISEALSNKLNFSSRIEEAYKSGNNATGIGYGVSYLNNFFNNILNDYLPKFIMQAKFADAFGGSYYNVNADKIIVTDKQTLISSLESFLNKADFETSFELFKIVKKFKDELNLGGTNFANLEGIKKDIMNGIFAESSNTGEFLLGTSANETLNGSNKDDYIIGNEGNDYLYGGAGNDTYIFGRGDGNDTIYNQDNSKDRTDIIKFKEGITKEDLIFERTNNGYDLLIKIKDGTDSITVNNMFVSPDAIGVFNQSNFINGLEFGDGSSMSAEEMKARILVNPNSSNQVYGFSTDDIIKGNENDNYLYAHSGNDIAYGYAGNDYIYGGAGNDTLYGGEGNDQIYGGNDNDIIFGNEGNDTLNGEAGDDILEGNEGNDYLYGGAGNDTYI